MIDATPRHVRDVKEPVDAAEVDEDAEVCDVLDDARANLLFGDLAEETLLEALALLLEELSATDDDVGALGVDLDDARADPLVDEVDRVAGPPEVDLARGEEAADTLHVDDQAALDLALDDALDLVTFVVLDADALPGALTICASLRQHRRVVVVVIPLVVDLKLLALLGEGLSELGDGDAALSLAPDVHDDGLAPLVYGVHHCDHDRSGSYVPDRLGQLGVKFSLRDAGEETVKALFELFFREVIALKARGGEGHIENGEGR